MSDETKMEGQKTPDETKPVELSDEALTAVAGGRKAGGGPKEYLIFKMNDVLITSVTPDTK